MKKLILGSLLFTLSAIAEINIKDGSFIKTWRDTAFLKRTFRSRSLHSGFFGYGWCSSLEKSLLIKSNGDLILKDCALDHDILLSRVKAGLWIYRNNIQVFEKSPGIFHLSYHKQLWTFNSIGRFLGDNKMKLIYEQNLLSKIEDQKRNRWQVTWDLEKRRIVSVTAAHGGQLLHYEYENDNLIKSECEDTSLMQYDSFHNLTKIQSGLEKNIETITYNNHLDLVTSHHDSLSKCLQMFSYKIDQDLRSRTIFKKQCGSKAPQITVFDFYYRKLELGTHILSQMRIRSKVANKKYQFDSLTGEAHEIKSKARIGEIHE